MHGYAQGMAELSKRRRNPPAAMPSKPPSRHPSSPPNAVVAAATRLQRPIRSANGAYGGPLKISTEAWTAEAWRQYDLCSELRFAVNWLANSIGRCRLTVCEVDPNGTLTPPTTNAQVLSLVSGILDNPPAQHELLSALTTNLTVAGDSYILALPSREEAFDEWVALSTSEISVGIDNKVVVNRGDQLPFTVDLDQSLVIRVHRPHPRCWWEADSPVRSALPLLREIEELSKYLFATVNSRLAGAGILALPSEMSFPSPGGSSNAPTDDFFETFTEACLAPIEDMSNPAAVIPVTIQAPREALGGIQWLVNPNGNLPDQIESLRDHAIRRLCMALDLNALDKGTANHWGEWAIEEQSIKFHVEPIMILICNALTVGLLKPSLAAAGIDTDRFVFWYDPADLINRPNKATDAKDLYDRDELSGAALRRETGFTEFDAPTGEEKAIRTALKVISLAPGFAETLIPHLLDALGLSSLLDVDPDELLPQPSDGTPAQTPTPDPNQDPRAIPVQQPPAPIRPRKDDTTPEPNRAA